MLALEYWCNDDEPVWREPDDSLVARTIEELHQTGLANRDDVASGKIVRDGLLAALLLRKTALYSQWYWEG